MLYESNYYGTVNLGDSIMHYGVKGQKWGLRRWQNADMSLTPAGRIHYGVGKGRKNTGKTHEDKNIKNGVTAKNLLRKLKADESSVSDKDLPDTPSKKSYLDALDELKKIEKVEYDYYGNEDLRRKYAKKVAEETWPEAVSKYGWGTGGDTKEAWIDMWVYEDFDQGDSFDAYLRDTRGEDGYKKYHTDLHNAQLKSDSSRAKYAREISGDHANDKSLKYKTARKVATYDFEKGMATVKEKKYLTLEEDLNNYLGYRERYRGRK